MINRRTFLAGTGAVLLAAPFTLSLLDLKTAKALGLTIPQSLLLRAEKVIE